MFGFTELAGLPIKTQTKRDAKLRDAKLRDEMEVS